MIGKWFRRRYTEYIVEDVKKIDAIRAELKKKNGGFWIAIPGFVSLVDADYKVTKDKTDINFNLDKGYILKAFVNINDGEVKLYSARLIVEDD